MTNHLAFAPHRRAQPGEVITFGIYPQTLNGADRTPIKWQVLQNSDGELFMLSKYILDCKRYDAEFTNVTWRDCDLKKLVKTTRCTDNGIGSPDTEDKVFLLSVAEVKQLTDTDGVGSSGTKRRAMGTEFAKVKKADGCHLYVYNKSVEADYIIENGQKHGCSWWWLRTQLHVEASRASFVGPRSSIRSYARVNLHRDGVRPAIKLKPL
jgi:hypothetical protein